MTALPITAADAIAEPHPSDFYGYLNLLSDEDKELIAKVRKFLNDKVAPVIDGYWARAEFPHQVWADFAELDIVGLTMDFPDRHHRSRLLSSFIVSEIARVDPSLATGFGVHAGLALGSIAICGSPEQHARWLPAMRRLEKIGAFALTEPEHGSDVAGGVSTTARRDGNEWVLNGAKRWIGNGTFADLVVVWARDVDDHQVKGFVVEKGTPGFSATKIENKLALRVVQNADITLTDCRVSDDNRLANANTFKDTAKVLRLTRGGVAWMALGAQMATFELARDYAVNRIQFGRPIAKFQLVQDHLATILANTTASLAIAVKVAQLQDEGICKDEQASMAKWFVTARLRESVARAREVFGGNGIVLDYKIARFFNDAEALYSYEGSREMNTLIVGRAATGMGAFV